jgi:lipooligosaccharide transport system permease protein
VLAAQALHTAVSESTYPVLGAVKWQRQYHAMLASPLTVDDIVIGHSAYVVLRGLLATASFAAVGAVLGAFTSWWVVLAVLVAVLCCAAHTLPVMAYAVGRENDNAFPMLFRFGVIPMFLFAGTFFPVEQLPPVLHQLARVTPLWHATELCRDLSLGTVDALRAAGHLGYLSLWVVVGAWFARREFTKRLVD